MRGTRRRSEPDPSVQTPRAAQTYESDIGDLTFSPYDFGKEVAGVVGRYIDGDVGDGGRVLIPLDERYGGAADETGYTAVTDETIRELFLNHIDGLDAAAGELEASGENPLKAIVAAKLGEDGEARDDVLEEIDSQVRRHLKQAGVHVTDVSETENGIELGYKIWEEDRVPDAGDA